MASLKQKIAFKEITENHGNASAAMRKAGYSENTIKKPTNLTNSKGFVELMEEYFPDKDLLKIHRQGLKAVKEIAGGNVIPDYAIRHRYLDTAYKIKGRYKENGIGAAIQINFRDDKERFA